MANQHNMKDEKEGYTHYALPGLPDFLVGPGIPLYPGREKKLPCISTLCEWKHLPHGYHQIVAKPSEHAPAATTSTAVVTPPPISDPSPFISPVFSPSKRSSLKKEIEAHRYLRQHLQVPSIPSAGPILAPEFVHLTRNLPPAIPPAPLAYPFSGLTFPTNHQLLAYFRAQSTAQLLPIPANAYSVPFPTSSGPISPVKFRTPPRSYGLEPSQLRPNAPISPTTTTMASGRPRLALGVQNLPEISEADASATASPARGREMRQNLLQKLRPPPLVHSWEFLHDRQDRTKHAGSPGPGGSNPQQPLTDAEKQNEADSYAERLVTLAEISDLREFWSVFNNFDPNALPQKDSVHLFKKGVKPVWEDARNVKGGAWTFRVSKEKAPEVWKIVCCLAVGEQLQDAVATKRISFNDDICGVSYSVRFGAVLITIWNRDGNNDEGKERIKQLVLEQLSSIWTPLASQVYYKKHSEHIGFVAPKGMSAVGVNAMSKA